MNIVGQNLGAAFLVFCAQINIQTRVEQKQNDDWLKHSESSEVYDVYSPIFTKRLKSKSLIMEFA